MERHIVQDLSVQASLPPPEGIGKMAKDFKIKFDSGISLEDAELALGKDQLVLWFDKKCCMETAMEALEKEKVLAFSYRHTNDKRWRGWHFILTRKDLLSKFKKLK